VTTAELTQRREHAATVAAMLDELAQVRQRIYVSKAFGARAAALRDLEVRLQVSAAAAGRRCLGLDPGAGITLIGWPARQR
jgi:hypothetical protein